MKKLISLIILVLCGFNIVFGEIAVKYNHNMCKMAIITSEDVPKTRNIKKEIEKKVMEFCDNKYIYDINITVDRCNNYIYVIFYNDINN